ncbi:hypothetical protein AWB70_04010 [Caballeronia cordobensis]|uniref:Uncharacterized protein n=1 Tax=Caballeronia cordobensis TaxID=1353886 RepID=A0A158I166_CABCO|nr:hypothetical protein [Caballeronia cordobensis]SAL50043.1 hypothetical protein AWB70_04010 [Caballeronia cordobensis]
MNLEFAALVFYRVLIVIGGILSIYFGYRLFQIDKQTQGDFGIKKGESYELRLRDVALGVFFALFGAFVLAISLFNGLTFKTYEAVAAPPMDAATATSDRAAASAASQPRASSCMSNRGGLSMMNGC